MGTVFGLRRRRTNAPVTALGTNQVLLIAELSPVRYSLLPSPLPLLLSQHSELLDDLFRLHLLHLATVGGLLQLHNVVLLVLQVLKDLEAGLLILFLKGRLGESQLPVFNSSFVFLVPLKLCAFFGFPHDSEIDLLLVGVGQSFVGLFDGVPGIFGARVFALIRMDDECKIFVLFFDFFIGSSCVELEDIIGVVKLLVGQSFKLNILFEGLGLDGLVLDGIDIFAIVVDLLFELVLLPHLLYII